MLVARPFGRLGIIRPHVVEIHSSTTADSNTQSLPSTVKAGDIGLFFYRGLGSGSPPTNVTPSGWTSATTTAIGSWRSSSAVKRLVDADASASVAGFTPPNWPHSHLLVLRPHPSANSISVQSAESQGTSGTPSTQTKNITAEDTLCIVIGWATHGGGGSNTISGTLADNGVDLRNSSDWKMRAIFAQRHAQRASYTWAMSDAGSENMLLSFYLRVT